MNYLKNILSLYLLIFLGVSLNAQTVTVTGQVNTPSGDPLTNISLTMTTGQQTLTTTTDNEGNYTFVDVPQNALVTLKPTSTPSLNPLNGVSTFDVVQGSKHILGLTPFDAAYKYIAMDVNLSGSVTVSDLILIRQLILGLISEIPDTDAWRFIEETQLASIKFDQSEMPEYSTDYPAIDFTPNADGLVTLNFVGVKVGDSSGNATSDF